MLGHHEVARAVGLDEVDRDAEVDVSGLTRSGLPSTSAKELFISGCAASARTSAYPMRWVKLTLPPRPRARWLLITMRLSASSFAGTARTLVAVGTCSDASMFCTIRAATPRSGVVLGAPAGGRGLVGAGWSPGRPSARAWPRVPARWRRA